MSEPTALSLTALSKALAKKKISSEEVTKAYLARIEKLDGKIGSYLLVDGEGALERARSSDNRRASGHAQGPLDGVPLGIKDVLVTYGMRTTAGSKILRNFDPPFEGTVMRRLREGGAVFLGKQNMDEFAMGSSNENSAYKPVRNPWDTERAPGGSSGGSAAAVAADLCAGSLGSDTGGSIRQPAAFCGVVGVKPTYGRVSRYGLIAFASSLDQIGPLTRTVEDSALLLREICGHDGNDSTSLDEPVPDFVAACAKKPADLRVGVPKQFFEVEGMDPEVEKAVRDAVKQLESLGAKIVDVDLPHTKYGVACYYLIAPAEASSNLARFDGVRYGHRAEGVQSLSELYLESRSQGFGPEVKRRIMLGTFCLSAGYYDAYYRKAQQVRRIICEDYLKAFEKCDVIAGPVTPTPPFKIGERISDPLQMYLSDVFTISVNLAGLPGMSLPCGLTSEGLPVGLQLIGPSLGEATLFSVAAAYERATDWHTRKPAL